MITILMVSTALAKIIGAIFRIPLIVILPEGAYGDFNGMYNIYSLFLTISAAGLPVALSRAISECYALGRGNQKRQAFRVVFYAFLFMGPFSFLCMPVFGQLVTAYIIGNEKVMFCMWALVPVVLCTCCCSALRGYIQGHINMMSTAVSQITEAPYKLFLGLGLAMVIMGLILWPEDIRNRLTASDALIGVPFSSVPLVVYLTFNHFRTRRGSIAQAAGQPDRSRVVLARLLKLAIPIILSSYSVSLVTVIDTNLVSNQLQNMFIAIQNGMADISNSFLDIFPKAVEIFQNNTDVWQQALLTDPATKLDSTLDLTCSLYGTYSKTMSVYNLLLNLIISLTACIVPGTSVCLARNDRLGAKRITEPVTWVIALTALPCSSGLLVLGGPIMELVALGSVDTIVVGPILSILGIVSTFVCLQSVGTTTLWVNGIVNLPTITVIIGDVTKILVNYILMGNPKIMIFGAPVGTLSYFVVTSILNLLIAKRRMPNPPRYLVALSEPLAASVAMAVAAWESHGSLAHVLSDSLTRNMAAVTGAIPVGVVVYTILVLALHILTQEDLEMMSGGRKLAKIPHIQ